MFLELVTIFVRSKIASKFWLISKEQKHYKAS